MLKPQVSRLGLQCVTFASKVANLIVLYSDLSSQGINLTISPLNLFILELDLLYLLPDIFPLTLQFGTIFFQWLLQLLVVLTLALQLGVGVLQQMLLLLDVFPLALQFGAGVFHRSVQIFLEEGYLILLRDILTQAIKETAGPHRGFIIHIK
jgi:hypothetical protein